MHVFYLILGLPTLLFSFGFARMANIVHVTLDYQSFVFISNGSVIMVEMVCPSCTMSIGDHDLISDLMALEMRTLISS